MKGFNRAQGVIPWGVGGLNKVVYREAQSHETPQEAEVQRLVYATRKEKDHGLKEELEEVKAMLRDKTQRAVDLAVVMIGCFLGQPQIFL